MPRAHTHHASHDAGHHTHAEGMPELLDLDAQVLGAYLPAVTAWAAEHATAVRTVLDLGAGTGVGSLALAERFPQAQVVALERSPAMIDRLTESSRAHDLTARLRVVPADLDEDWPDLGAADLVWAPCPTCCPTTSARAAPVWRRAATRPSARRGGTPTPTGHPTSRRPCSTSSSSAASPSRSAPATRRPSSTPARPCATSDSPSPTRSRPRTWPPSTASWPTGAPTPCWPVPASPSAAAASRGLHAVPGPAAREEAQP